VHISRSVPVPVPAAKEEENARRFPERQKTTPTPVASLPRAELIYAKVCINNTVNLNTFIIPLISKFLHKAVARVSNI
jgi:hypothetical protein